MRDPYLDEYLKTILEQLKRKYTLTDIKNSFQNITTNNLLYRALSRLITGVAVLTLGPLIVSSIILLSVFLGGDISAYILVVIGMGSSGWLAYQGFISTITPKKTLLIMTLVSIYLSFVAYSVYQALLLILTKVHDQSSKALVAKGQGGAIVAILGSPDNLLPVSFFIVMIILFYTAFPLVGLLKK